MRKRITEQWIDVIYKELVGRLDTFYPAKPSGYFFSHIQTLHGRSQGTKASNKTIEKHVTYPTQKQEQK